MMALRLRYKFSELINKDIIWIILFMSVCGGMIFKGPWYLSFFIALILLGVILLYINLNLAIPFLILLIPITRFPGVTEYVEPAKCVIFSLALFFWFIKKDFSDLRYIKDSPLNIFFIIFSVLILVNLIISMNTSLTLRSAFSHLIAFGCFYLFLDIFQNRKYFKKVIYLFILTGVFVGALAIIQYILVQFKIFTGLEKFILPPSDRYNFLFRNQEAFALGGYRSVGTFYHPNLLGLYLSLVFPLVLCFMAYVQGKLKKAFLGIFALVILGGIFSSGSRGAFLNIIVSSVFLLIIFWKRIPKVLLVSSAIIFVSLVTIFFNEARLYFWRPEALSYRDIIWSNSLKMIGEKPVLGWGLGTFHKEYFARYGFPSILDFKISLSEIVTIGSLDPLKGFHAHNLFLNYAAEMGVLAPFLMLLFYIIYMREFLYIWRIKNSISSFDYSLIMGCTAVILGNFIHSFFEATTNFYNFSISVSFILIIGIGMSIFSYYKSNSLTLNN